MGTGSGGSETGSESSREDEQTSRTSTWSNKRRLKQTECLSAHDAVPALEGSSTGICLAVAAVPVALVIYLVYRRFSKSRVIKKHRRQASAFEVSASLV